MSLREKISSYAHAYPIGSALVKLVCYYFLILRMIYLYVGISTPGGVFDFPFFEKIYLIPIYIQSILAPIQWFYEAIGYTITPIPHGIVVLFKGGVFVEFACIGVKIVSAWFALILAFPGKKKLLFLGIGLGFIHLLNTLRIALVFYADVTYPDKDYVALSHDMYNIVGYGMIVGLFYFWLSKYGEK